MNSSRVLYLHVPVWIWLLFSLQMVGVSSILEVVNFVRTIFIYNQWIFLNQTPLFLWAVLITGFYYYYLS